MIIRKLIHISLKTLILCSVLTHSDEFLITGTQDRTINVIKIDTGDVVQTTDKHLDAVTALAISLDDFVLVSGKLLELLRKIIRIILIISLLNIASLDKSVKRWLLDGLILVDNIITESPVTHMVITCDNTFIIMSNSYFYISCIKQSY